MDRVYHEMTLASVRALNIKLNNLDWNLKKIPERDAIFEQVHKTSRETNEKPKGTGISIYAKTRMSIRELSRGCHNRVLTKPKIMIWE